MCGIAGILRVHPPGTPPPPPELAIPESWLDILDDSIKHRGPDGQGRFRDRAVRADGSIVDVAFVHRRLSILDHAGGAQPMVSVGRPSGRSALRADSLPLYSTPNTAHSAVGSPTVGSESRPTSGPTLIFHGKPNDQVRYRPLDPATTAGLVAVVFNGCIYNHRELRKELQAAGHVFESDHSDTEVLVHGWREWKSELFHRLNGMFALLIWDASTATLSASRDRFGEKPLYQTSELNEGSIAFSSSASGIERMRRAWARSSRTVSPSAVHGWLNTGYEPGPPLTDVTSVSPGRWSVVPGEPDIFPDLFPITDHLWDKSKFRRGEPAKPDEISIETLLRHAVRTRLEADSPLGAFLSGGVDSSLISIFAHQERGSLDTLCVRMPSAEYDESSQAAQVARIIGSRHSTIDVASNPAHDLVALIEQLGLPFGDSSLLPMYWLCRATRDRFRVVLGGDGGDEMFFGYERYQASAHLRRLAWLLRFIPTGLLSQQHPKSRSAKLARLIDAARNCGYWDLIAIFPSSLLTRLAGQSTGFDWSQRYRLTPDEARWMDLSTYLPRDLMCKADTASMAVSLELRSPFLDTDVANAVRHASASELMPHNQRKGLLRAVARKYFPPEIVDRPKQGFAIPIGEWFRSDYGGMKQLLLDHLNSAEPWGSPALGIDLNMKFVRQMLDEHMGTGMSGRVTRDHSQRLYMLLVLSIWAKWLSKLS